MEIVNDPMCRVYKEEDERIKPLLYHRPVLVKLCGGLLVNYKLNVRAHGCYCTRKLANSVQSKYQLACEMKMSATKTGTLWPEIQSLSLAIQIPIFILLNI